MNTNIVTQNRFLAGAVLAAAFVLAVNLVAMQVTDEVDWSWFDFAAASVLLLGGAAAFGLATAWVRKVEHKWLVAGAVLGVLFLVWVELGVGLVGSSLAGS